MSLKTVSALEYLGSYTVIDSVVSVYGYFKLSVEIELRTYSYRTVVGCILLSVNDESNKTPFSLAVYGFSLVSVHSVDPRPNVEVGISVPRYREDLVSGPVCLRKVYPCNVRIGGYVASDLNSRSVCGKTIRVHPEGYRIAVVRDLRHIKVHTVFSVEVERVSGSSLSLGKKYGVLAVNDVCYRRFGCRSRNGVVLTCFYLELLNGS